MQLTAWLKKEISYVPNGKTAAIVGVLVGLTLSLLIILLQPFDTYQHQSPYKNLSLLGYTPVVMLAAILVVPLEHWLFRLQDQKWRVWQEGMTVTIGGMIMMSLSHVYNAIVINDILPTWSSWWFFMKGIAMPFFVFLSPIWILLRQKVSLFQAAVQEESEALLTITGQNKGEHLEIVSSQFLYAQAQQNYTEVYYQDEEGTTQKRILRLSLSQLQQQIPDAKQSHRSYLINPLHIKSFSGNARKRFLQLGESGLSLPVSSKYYDSLKEGPSNSAQ